MSTHFPFHKLCVFASVLISSVAFANPSLNNIASGNVNVTQTHGNTVIDQASQKAILNWNSFNIAAGEKTQFVQPNASSVALNRINPNAGVSQIYGTLTANGKIILVNGAGIHFGPGAMVNVGGMIASTSDISNANFLAGHYVFDQPSAYAGSIVNEGTLIAANHGLIALIGHSVENNGMIQAELGSIVLASGNKFTLDFYGDQLINFSVDEGTTGGTVKNDSAGILLADGGKILVTAKTAEGVLDNVISMDGVTQAHSVSQQHGEIILDASEGAVTVAGNLDVSGTAADTTGGTVKVLGANVHLTSTAKIDARGTAGGGEILVGGNFHGAGPEANASTTTVDSGAILNASAITKGNGGKVAIWSNIDTEFHGSIFAMGGAQAGDGGYVETSGENLSTQGAIINTLAPYGKTGTWLIDPLDVTISNNPTSNDALSSGTYSPSATGANINASDLNTALGTSNIVITTGGTGSTGSDNGDITVFGTTDSGGAAAISWSNSNTLTLSAYRNIVLNAGSSITNTSNGSLVLQANNSGAFLTSATGGNVTNNGTITISGTGTVTSYYNPNNYISPVSTSTLNAGTSTVTAYMLINSLGTANDDDSTTGASANLTLGALSNASNSSILSNNFALSTNIDASATNNGSGWSSTGFRSLNNFTGLFDGQNHYISNLYEQGNAFGFINSNNGTISNLGLVNANINFSGATFAAILVAQNYGNIYNSYATGTGVFNSTSGGVNTGYGGLVGVNFGNISNSSVSATLTQSGSFGIIGGFVGIMSGGTINDSFTTGTVYISSSSSLGAGFVGETPANSISTSTNYTASINNAYTNMNVISLGSNNAIGGFAGYDTANSADTVSINNSYSTGAVISNQTGGFTAVTSGFTVYTHDYWDTDTSGLSNALSNGSLNNVTGMTTAALQSALPTGFSSSDWGILPGYSYPYLLSIFPSAPFIISGNVSGSGYGTVVSLANGANSVTPTQSAGLAVGSTSTYVNGYYYFAEPTSTFQLGNIILVSTTNANIVDTVTAQGAINGLDLIANQVTIGDSVQSQNISNTILGKAYLNGVSLYNATGSAPNYVITGNSGVNFVTSNQTTFIADGTLSATGGGTLTFNGGVEANNPGTLMTDGGQINFNDAVNLSSSLVVKSESGSINFNGSVSGSSLTLQDNTAASTGNVTFSQGVNLDSLVTFAQPYAVSLQGNSTDEFINAVTFNNTNGVTLGAGNNIIFDSGVTSTASSTTLNGTVNSTNSTLTLGNVTVIGTGILESGSGTMTLGALSGSDLTINSSTAFALNNSINVNSLTVSGGGNTTISTATITTAGSQVYNNPITLGAVLALTSSGGNGITFNNTIDGAYRLSIGNNSGAISFNANVGLSTPLASLTTGTNAPVTLSNTIQTSGNQTYGSVIALANNTTLVLTGNNSTISINAGVNSPSQSLTLQSADNSTGDVFFTRSAIHLINLTATGGANSNTSLVPKFENPKWHITGANAGNLTNLSGSTLTGSYSFSNISNIGGQDVGNFTFSDGASISGNVAGGSSGVLNLSSYSTATNVTLTGSGGTGFSGTVSGIAGTFTGITSITGGSNTNNNSVTGENVTNTWTVNLNNKTSYNDGSHSLILTAFGKLIGGTGDDTFILTNGHSITGSIDGGAGGVNTLDFSGYTTDITVSFSNSTINGYAGTTSGSPAPVASFSNITQINGGTGNNTLVGEASENTWEVTSNNAGTYNDNQNSNAVGFNNFANITANIGNDNIVIDDGALLSGNITGVGGQTLLDLSNWTTPVSVNLATNTATGVGGSFSRVVAFTGNDGTTGSSSSLTGTSGTTTWDITGPNYLSVNSQTYTANGFGNLVGGNGNNTYTFEDGASLSGSITGGGGTNVLDFSNYLTPVNIALTGSSAAGFLGSASTIIASVPTTILASFSQIAQVNGSSYQAANSTLASENTANIWRITGNNSGTYNDGSYTLTFTNFGSLTGNADNDTFVFSDGASISGTIDGGAGGTNILDASAYTSQTQPTITGSSLTGFSGTSNMGNFSNVTQIVGSNSVSDIIYGENTNSIWNITGNNSGTYNDGSGNTPLVFSHFGSLSGGTLNDTFNFTDASTLSGTIDGGAGGTNIANFASYTTAIDATLTGSTSNGFSGTSSIANFAEITQLNGSSSAPSRLAGENTISIWSITDNNSGTYNDNSGNTALSFSNFGSLTGGISNNTYAFTDAKTLSGTINGGTGGINILDFSNYTTSTDVTLTGNSVNGLTGSSSIANFSAITQLIGSTTASNTLAGQNTTNNWNITGSNSGLYNDTNGNSPLSFSNFANLTGGSVNDSFVLNGGSLSGALNGGTGTSTLTANNIANTWVITGANSGTVNGIAGGFSNVRNLTGGSSTDTFTLNGGTLSGYINGGSGTNTLTAANVANTWNIIGSNAGNVTGIGSFSNIQNLTGGTLNNTFIFANNASLSGSLDGGSPTATNTLNYTAYTTPVMVTMNTETSGFTQNSNNVTITNFQNINNLLTTNGSLTIANNSKTNMLYITGGGSGYLNDPINFTGIYNYISSPGSTTNVIFNSPATYSNGTATINGVTITFINMANFSGSIISNNPQPVVTPVVINNAANTPIVISHNVSSIITPFSMSVATPMPVTTSSSSSSSSSSASSSSTSGSTSTSDSSSDSNSSNSSDTSTSSNTSDSSSNSNSTSSNTSDSSSSSNQSIACSPSEAAIAQGVQVSTTVSTTIKTMTASQSSADITSPTVSTGSGCQ